MNNSFKILLTILITGFSNIQAQNQIDSLLGVLNNNISDQDRVDIYNEITHHLDYSDSIQIKEYSANAISLATKIGYNKGIVYAQLRIAILNFHLGNISKSQQQFQELLVITETFAMTKEMAICINRLGEIDSKFGNYDDALHKFLIALKLFQEQGSQDYIASSYNDIGIVHFVEKNYEKALGYHFKSLEIKKNNKDIDGMANSYNNIGICYDQLGQFDLSLEYYSKALAFELEFKDKQAIAINYNNIAMVYKNIGDLDKALEFSYKSLKLFKEIGIDAYTVYAILTTAEIYLEQEKWNPAKEYLIEGLNVSRKYRNKENILFAAKGLSEVNKQQGNFKEAYEYQVLFKQMEDSLRNENQTEKITRLEAEYQFQMERDSIQFANTSQLLVLEKKAERSDLLQTFSIIIVILLTAIIIILLWFFYSFKKASKKISEQRDHLKESLEKLEKTQLHLVQSEKLAAISSLASGVAHEINNPLNFIQGSIEGISILSKNFKEEDEKEISRLLNYSREGIQRASQIIRILNNFNQLKSEQQTIVDLGQVIRDCLEILQYETENVKICNNVPVEEYYTNIKKADIHIALVSILQNAIESIIEDGTVIISSKVKNDSVVIQIQDSGKGIQESMIKRISDPFYTTKSPEVGKGMGLAVALKCINENQGEIIIDSTEGIGTTISITLPLFVEK